MKPTIILRLNTARPCRLTFYGEFFVRGDASVDGFGNRIIRYSIRLVLFILTYDIHILLVVIL
jgi:hypothetical protein